MPRLVPVSILLLGLAACTSHESQVPDTWMFVPSMPPTAAPPEPPPPPAQDTPSAPDPRP